MKTKDAIDHAGSATALSKILGVSLSAISQWGEDIPQARYYQLRVLKPRWFRQPKAVAVELSQPDQKD
jgi:hypothetical protein